MTGISKISPERAERELALRRIRRAAVASFENAVRLHEDAVLMFEHARIPSALHTSALSIEEIGKYFMHEDVWWHNRIGETCTIQEMQEFLREAYSHRSKQKWFARHANRPFISRPLLKLLQDGELEGIKQKATYVGMARRGRNIDFTKRLSSPFRTSRRHAEGFLTMVNDYLVVLSVGTRKGFYLLDIPEIDNWLAEPEFERHLVDLWPKMAPSARRHIARMHRHEDIDRE